MHDFDAHEVITALVNAEAYPGPGGALVLSEYSKASWTARLEMLANAKFVQEHPKDHWSITEYGAAHLRVSRSILGCERVLLPRPNVAVENLTTWELLTLLEADGWKCLPAPVRRSLAPIKLDEDIPMEERIVYCNRKKLDISADYLRCMLTWQAIRDRGVSLVNEVL